MNEITINGEYEHYKGHHYKVLAIAKHSETLEDVVVYQALYGDNQIWVRSKNMFLESVEVEGKTIPRFKLIS